MDRVHHTIRTQFDFEILLKRKEILAIRDEINKGEEMLYSVRQAIATAHAQQQAQEMAIAAAKVHQHQSKLVQQLSSGSIAGGLSSAGGGGGGGAGGGGGVTPASSSSVIKRTSKSIKAHYPSFGAAGRSASELALHVKRDDGVVVKLVCPECKRSDFVNLQGFINHSKSKHKLEYGSHYEAVR